MCGDERHPFCGSTLTRRSGAVCALVGRPSANTLAAGRLGNITPGGESAAAVNAAGVEATRARGCGDGPGGRGGGGRGGGPGLSDM